MEPTKEQIDLIKRTVAKDATDDELKLFLHTARKVNLDPLLGQIQFIKRRRKNKKTGKWEEFGQTLFGRDSWRIVADRTEKVDGSRVTPNFDGDNKLVSATATVWKKDCAQPFEVTVFLKEYYDPGRSFLWKTKPITMLCKVAEKQALTMAFPDLLAPAYAPEEFGLTDSDIKALPGPLTEEEARPGLPPPAGEGETKTVPRPAPAEQVRKWLRDKAAERRGDRETHVPATKAQIGLAASRLEAVWEGDEAATEKRRSFLGYVFGHDSLKDLDISEVAAVLDWLVGEKDEEGRYPFKEHAEEEARLILRQHMLDSGQAELNLEVPSGEEEPPW